MNIKTTKPMTMRDSSTGKLISPRCGQILSVTKAVGDKLVADGLAVVYSEIVPTGEKSIVANGTYDVTQYASASINVGTFTITYDANGGTGSVDSVTVVAGNSTELSDGTGLTAPEGKTFSGWATESTAETSDVESPYTPEADITLYAVYVNA